MFLLGFKISAGHKSFILIFVPLYYYYGYNPR